MHAFQPLHRPSLGQPAWTHPRRLKHPLPDKVFDQRRMVEGELACEEGSDAASFREVSENSLDPPQVDDVLGRTTAVHGTTRHRPRCAWCEAVIVAEEIEDLDKVLVG